MSDAANRQIANTMATEVVRALDAVQQVPSGVKDEITASTALASIADASLSSLWIWKQEVQGKKFLDRLNRVLELHAPAAEMLYPGDLDKANTPADLYAVLLKAAKLKAWYDALSKEDKQSITAGGH